jgi:aminopeptidase N
MRRSLLPAAIIATLLVIPMTFLAGISQGSKDTIGTEADQQIPLPQNRELLRAGKARLEPLMRDAKSYTPHSYDVLHYEINMDIDIPGDTVRTASVYIDCESRTDTLTTVDLRFFRMTIDSLTVDGGSTPYTRDDDQLLIHLDSAISEGDTFQVAVHYHGRPITGFVGLGLFISPTITYSIGAPEGAYRWYPCYDHPSDKATADLNITVPAGYFVASNGTLLEVRSDQKATETYRWSETYPISTYLICVAIAQYTSFSMWYYTDQDTMEIPIWVDPSDSANAAADFANLPDMTACYADLFGPYPFIEEKYAMATFNWGGAMEHQTCVSWGFPITGGQDYEHVVAHELSHMWWGDWVTYDDFADVWLNEGFATYCEALWWEYLYGEVGLQTYMEDMQDYYIWWEHNTGQRFPIYDPPSSYLYSATTYEKGGCVLHMLRFVVGDSTFIDILRTYGITYAYANAVTADFQAVCEAETGQDLDWFFDQWIYDQGWPEYDLLWSSSNQGAKGYVLYVAVSQLQENAPIFDMPVELGILTASGSVLDTVTIDEEQEYFQFVLSEEPLAVELDPNQWMLCEQQETSVSDTTAPETIADLAIELDDGAKSASGDMRLWWTGPNDDVGVIRYVVYRSTAAGTLGDSLAGTTDTAYQDSGAAGDVFTNYYYIIKAVDWVENKSDASNQVGEFDRSLISGE